MDSLWKNYKESGDRQARDQLVKRYLPYVKKLSKYVCSRLPDNIRFDEVQSYAYNGLLDAIERYDFNRNDSFEAYAGIRIKGSVYDELRKQDWLPRAVKEKGNINMVSIDQLRELDNAYEPISLENNEEYAESESFIQPDFAPGGIDRMYLVELINKLKPVQKTVVFYYYYAGLTLKEIGNILGYTEGGISLVHKRAITNLRKMASN